MERSQSVLELPQGWVLTGDKMALESSGLKIHNGQLTKTTSVIHFDYAALRNEEGVWLAELDGVRVKYSCCEHLDVQKSFSCVG